jgi:phage replication-related protein YjqB (UPF0714/DUF867 family)
VPKRAASKDIYRNFAHLAEHETEGKDFHIRVEPRDSSAVVIAPHGGRIEPRTKEIAMAIAKDDTSFYSFEAIRSNELHITSSRFDEPRCLKLVRKSALVLAIHGCRNEHDRDKTVYFGGLYRERIKRFKAELKKQGFAVADHPKLKGDHVLNICNRGTNGKGIQLELPMRLRVRLTRSKALMDKFVLAARQTIEAG